MMMMPPKKKAATLILGMMGPKSPEGQDAPAEGAGDDDEVALNSVAEDILKAVAQKNPKALSAALSHFFYICDKDEDEESPEEESKEGE